MNEVVKSEKAARIVRNFKEKYNRQAYLSLGVCVHCGMCSDSCHYYLATGDPKMTPAYKADQVRKLYKYHIDFLGRIFPRWVGGGTLETDEDLEKLKDIVFGSCTMCRRCTFNCPFGVDKALIMRFARGLLTREGIAPEGVLAVNKDQWETGNQMGVSQEEYLETIEWLQEELQAEVDDPKAEIPIDKKGANVVYVVNPREVKYAPLSLLAAAKIFYVAKENWTMPSVGWDNTSFGLFSGLDDLGAHIGKLAYDQAIKLGVNKMVLSECGHGFRATKWEAPNWAGMDLPFPIESFLETMVDYVNAGRIVLDPSKNPDPVTYHDPCNLARSGGPTEEPRFLLKRSCMDFREMYPNRADNYCCTGGGGALSMAEYAQRRLEVAKIKADQIMATGAKVVATGCHNCIDGLTDLIRHYKINIPVKNVCEFIADAIVLPVELPRLREPVIEDFLKGKKILVIDDEPDVITFLTTFLEDHGFEALAAHNGKEGLELARAQKPDLITLDISMPGKSGVQVFTELRSDPETVGVPVCIITGVVDFRQLMYHRTVQAPEGYLDKPINEELLLMTVKKIIELSHQAAHRQRD
ncbi:MAG: response regulator [Deltaproteobacteria bacterium]|nr:response regulator [Deltaproteobacteria bacterium]MBW2306616.1 response regulator [Deltaproteobacteria bacterium]